ncbi:MAG: hypothetical protein NT026_00425 [Candidatus Staskawiczbacteria bacterium]|nr:hypothetical protein [Candidatus Staskawiczbacteria bacterium]
MDNKTVILIIVIAIVMFFAGGGVGMMVQNPLNLTPAPAPTANTNASAANATATATIKALSSKVVPSITAYGKVTSINGNKITLSSGGDSIIMNVIENVPVFSSMQQIGLPNAQNQPKLGFKDIKKGDILNITLKVLPDGQFLGQEVVIVTYIGNPPPDLQ